MHKHPQPEAVRQLDGFVAGVVVDENAGVDEIRKLPDGCFQGLLGVVRRQHDRDMLPVDHQPGNLNWFRAVSIIPARPVKWQRRSQSGSTGRQAAIPGRN
jgi:hypothetical protein